MANQFKIISKNNLLEYKEEILEFYKNYRYPEGYSKAIDNSAFIAICFDGEKIVGAGRVVSDMSRFALIVDLNVLKAHQKKGIGKQLVKNLVDACLKERIRYIELSTDPQFPWLEDFYKKIGFSKVENAAHFEWPRL